MGEANNYPEVRWQTATSSDHRRVRQQRMTLAWGTSLLSKAATVGVQVLAVPLVYRALGDTGYAAYAAVTASAGLVGVLNLGIGGSLVTPISDAAAKSDLRRQAILVQAGLGPLILLCLLGSLVVIPTVALLPLSTLFGKVGIGDSWDLRAAALIAVSATLATIPLSAVSFLRQAYQEMHISNLIGAASNALVCLALFLVVTRSTMVAAFVAVFVLIPLGSNVFNLGLLLSQRRFLLRREGRKVFHGSRQLLSDGVRFLGAAFANVLVFQWPVYWIARTLPASTSSLFAVCVQATVLPLGFVFGFLQPLWPSTADALARADHRWLNIQMRRARAVSVLAGSFAFLIFFLFGEELIHLWLRKPVKLTRSVCGLMGAYILLAIWEYFHFIIAMGLGRLRQATSAIFQRSLAFALAVPLLAMSGGVEALWLGMCCSILFWTAWRLPRLLHAQVREVGQAERVGT